MPLVNMRDMLAHAYDNSYAIGAFDLVNLETISDNIEITRTIVGMAHSCGVPVEGELGYVPGVEGEDAERHPGEIAYTTVADAKDYVAQTGIDFLAVSIGSVHGRMQGEPKLDFQRLQKINEKLGIPLVIHGGTGSSDE